jgi:hypothetical protein
MFQDVSKESLVNMSDYIREKEFECSINIFLATQCSAVLFLHRLCVESFPVIHTPDCVLLVISQREIHNLSKMFPFFILKNVTFR